MGINTDPNNCQLPVIKASAVLLMSKYWIICKNEASPQDLELLKTLIVSPFSIDATNQF